MSSKQHKHLCHECSKELTFHVDHGVICTSCYYELATGSPTQTTFKVGSTESVDDANKQHLAEQIVISMTHNGNCILFSEEIMNERANAMCKYAKIIAEVFYEID